MFLPLKQLFLQICHTGLVCSSSSSVAAAQIWNKSDRHISATLHTTSPHTHVHTMTKMSFKARFTVYVLGHVVFSACCLFCWTGFNWFEVVFGPFVRNKINHTLDFCLYQPGWIECNKAKEYLRSYCPNIYCGLFQRSKKWGCADFQLWLHLMLHTYLVSRACLFFTLRSNLLEIQKPFLSIRNPYFFTGRFIYFNIFRMQNKIKFR